MKFRRDIGLGEILVLLGLVVNLGVMLERNRFFGEELKRQQLSIETLCRENTIAAHIKP